MQLLEQQARALSFGMSSEATSHHHADKLHLADSNKRQYATAEKLKQCQDSSSQHSAGWHECTAAKVTPDHAAAPPHSNQLRGA